MIAIIDYGMGNLASVKNAFAKLGYETYTTSDPNQIVEAEKVVLPGVGAFADAIKNLSDLGIDQSIYEVVKRRIPLLGICLGLQLLFTESVENGVYKGLDVIEGRVEKLPPLFKVPHMGWNSVETNPESRIFKGIPSGSYFYFVHSYYVDPADISWQAGQSSYGLDFVSAVEKNNIFATQFHPEKSSLIGLEILKNFGEML